MFEALVKKGVAEIIKKVEEGTSLTSFVAIFSNIDGLVIIKDMAGEIVHQGTLVEHGIEIPKMIMDSLIITKYTTQTKVRAVKNGKEIMRFDA